MSMEDVFVEWPVVQMDRPRKLILEYGAWRRMEPIFRGFLPTWTALLRVVNTNAAAQVLRSMMAESTADQLYAVTRAMEQQGPILDDLAIILWAGFLRDAEDHGEKLTIPMVERHMKITRVREYIEAITKAVELAAPPKEESDDPTPPAAT